MEFLLPYLPAWVLPYFRMVTPEQWRYAVHATFFCLVAGGLWFSVYCFRRGFGWQKFKGRWYGPEDAENLKQELYSGVRDGRLPDAETMAFLDKHVYGKESKFRRMSGTGWL